jgi:putative flippase GtrA
MSASVGRREKRLPRLLQNSMVRYLLAGGVAFLVDFGLLALFHEVFGWVTWLAAGVAFILSFAFTYVIQRVFSFESSAPHGKALIKYTLLVAFNTLATAIIVGLVDQSALSWAGGKVISTAVTTVWNYFAYKYWVFASPRPADIEPEPGED